MRSKFVLIAVVLLVAVATAQVPETDVPQKPKKSRALVYTLEGLGALGGVAGCGCLTVGPLGVVLVVNLGFESYNAPPWAGPMTYAAICAAAVSAAALPAAAGYGAAKAGEWLGEDGSRGWAIVGAYAGTVVGAGLVAYGVYAGPQDLELGIPFYVVGGLAIPTGAVVGYNLGPKPVTASRAFEERIQLPRAILTSAELPDHSVEYGVKVQLAGLRF
jgi:hypothetical protein